MVNQDLYDKIKALRNAKVQIKENIDKIKITDKTILTLKRNNFKFKLDDYYFKLGITKGSQIERIIMNKTTMSYKYCHENRFNYFEDDKIKNAFFNFLKKILISNVIREFYDKVKKYKDYQFPFENKDLEYL